MKIKGRRKSSNIEDRRGRSGGSFIGGGGGKAGSFGIGTVIIMIIVYFIGGNPLEYLGVSNGGGSAPVQTDTPRSEGGVATGATNSDIVEVVLAETEDTWNNIFQQQYGRNYQEPVLVMFDRQVRSACGMASSATGPFYCPGDNKVYIDLSFADELRQRFGAPGDFALAYVVAHEVGHHVQNLLGYSQPVAEARRRMSEEDANAMSVRLELQADYLAGVWAKSADQRADILESGDIQEGIGAATAIGDDRLQKQSQGYVVPESFTHGTSEQRVRAFKSGYETGDASKEALDRFFSSRNL